MKKCVHFGGGVCSWGVQPGAVAAFPIAAGLAGARGRVCFCFPPEVLLSLVIWKCRVVVFHLGLSAR